MNRTQTRALKLAQQAGLTLYDAVNVAREAEFLRIPGFGRKCLSALREMALPMMPTQEVKYPVPTPEAALAHAEWVLNFLAILGKERMAPVETMKRVVAYVESTQPNPVTQQLDKDGNFVEVSDD